MSLRGNLADVLPECSTILGRPAPREPAARHRRRLAWRRRQYAHRSRRGAARRPDEVLYGVDAFAAGHPEHLFHEVVGVVVETGVAAQLEDTVDLALRAGGEIDRGARVAGHLHGRRPDAAAAVRGSGALGFVALSATLLRAWRGRRGLVFR